MCPWGSGEIWWQQKSLQTTITACQVPLSPLMKMLFRAPTEVTPPVLPRDKLVWALWWVCAPGVWLPALRRGSVISYPAALPAMTPGNEGAMRADVFCRQPDINLISNGLWVAVWTLSVGHRKSSRKIYKSFLVLSYQVQSGGSSYDRILSSIWWSERC